MSHQRSHILVVAHNRAVSDRLAAWFTDAGYQIAVADGFASAKTHLRTAPDLVVTELKLGDYNGLHLALKARAMGIPTVVLGTRDLVLERDAAALGAVYLGPVLERPELLQVIDGLLPQDAPVYDRAVAVYPAESVTASL